MTFFWCKFGFWKSFGASQSNHWAGHCWLSYKTHFLFYITIRWRKGSSLLCRIILIFGQLMRHPLTELFHLSSLLLMPCDHRMVDTDFLGNFLCSCKRISFSDGSWLSSASHGWLLCSSSSRLLFPLQNFLNHHCTVHSLAVPGPNVLLILWVVSIALQPILNSNKKIAQNWFLSTLFL